MKRACLLITACIAAFTVFAGAMRADEFHLKDGTTIVGTIVGFDKNSFRVKTSYGFALVQRSAIASITIANPASSATEKNASAPKQAEPKAEKHDESATLKSSGSAAPARKVEVADEAKLESTEKPQNGETKSAPPTQPAPAVNAAQTAAAAQTPGPAAAPSQAPVQSQAPPPAPVPVREEVRGNYYVNDTYGFAIYKPPDWDVIAGARAALPGAIVAMGTPDQTTYLIIGLEPAGGTLATHVAATNERMAGMFDDFRPLTVHQTNIAGMTASVYQFNGSADGKEWTGTVALLARGDNVYTILGVTSANTDLVQIQQNVISRTISSLQFGNP